MQSHSVLIAAPPRSCFGPLPSESAGNPASPRRLLLDTLLAAIAMVIEAQTARHPVMGTRIAKGRHARQRMRMLGLYAAHVVFGLSQRELAMLSGIHRTSVVRGCAKIEDMRDDRAFDDWLGAIEVALQSLSLPAGGSFHG